jgi:hypothetical protein
VDFEMLPIRFFRAVVAVRSNTMRFAVSNRMAGGFKAN